MRTAYLLWLLTALFFLGVIGQALVEFVHVGFLPPAREWSFELVPYQQSLAGQIIVLLFMTKINWDFARQSGWTYQNRAWLGTSTVLFGAIYLIIFLAWYIVRMTLYPHERWTGGSIPIFVHLILAVYLLVCGWHHWTARRQQPLVRSRFLVIRLLRLATRLMLFALTTTAIAAWVAYLLLPSILAWQLGVRRAEYAVRTEQNVVMEASDGVKLSANIYHPRRAGETTPTILVRMPYTANWLNGFCLNVVGQMWAERGYTVVIQATRGRGKSGGTHDPLFRERQDGIDTLVWLAKQPWYDGQLGMWGCSYSGYTEWAISDQRDPGPSALIIGECSSDLYHMFYPSGAFSLKSALYWAAMSHGDQDVAPTEKALTQGISAFPLIQADDRAVRNVPFFNDWVQHPKFDDYWKQVDGEDRHRQLRAPALLMAGWYDPFLPTQLEDFNRIRRDASPDIASKTRLIIGPWAHAETVNFPDGKQPRDFRLESLAPTIDWFDRHLQQRKLPETAPVKLYVMGLNEWRDEQEWPLARTTFTPYYLHSKGTANTGEGDGTLMPNPPDADSIPDIYMYDPRNPVPTRGGAMLGYAAANSKYNAGIQNQNKIESRQDVLAYTSDPLRQDVEVTGPVELVLFVSTSAPSTDFTAKLVDVHPGGAAFNVSDGILRQSYSTPSPEISEIKITLWPTSTVFFAGHRIRLEVSSSNYPRYDRNPNTGTTNGTEVQAEPAVNVVHHDIKHASRLILPIIPASRVK